MKLIKNIVIFLAFGAIYYVLESIWKGSFEHWYIFILGGLISTLISNINEKIEWDMPFFQQATIGLGVAIFSEAFVGIVLNIILNLNIWHYDRLTFFWHQCSLSSCVLWFILSIACILFDDWLRWRLLGEEKPHYSLR